MREFTRYRAVELLLAGIQRRYECVIAVYETLPDWKKQRGRAWVDEELILAAEDGFVKWRPSDFFTEPLTRHQLNLAGTVIREMAEERFVELVFSGPRRVVWVRLLDRGKVAARQADQQQTRKPQPLEAVK